LLKVALGLASVVAAAVEIAFSDNSEGADGGEHPALRGIDFVHAVSLSHWPPLTSARQVEILREHVARIALLAGISFACSAATPELTIPERRAVSIITRVVPVHGIP
jgi:hypothetical protein